MLGDFLQQDLPTKQMPIETAGGFDYTGADCCAWMRQAGPTSTRVQLLVGPHSMLNSMLIGIK